MYCHGNQSEPDQKGTGSWTQSLRYFKVCRIYVECVKMPHTTTFFLHTFTKHDWSRYNQGKNSMKQKTIDSAAANYKEVNLATPKLPWIKLSWLMHAVNDGEINGKLLLYIATVMLLTFLAHLSISRPKFFNQQTKYN